MDKEIKRIYTILQDNKIIVKTLAEIKDGLSNRNYLINNKYVLKISYDNQYFLKDKNIIDLQNKLADLNLSSKIISYDLEKGYLISNYIPHLQAIDVNKINLLQIKNLINLIKTYKSFDINLEKFNYQKEIDNYRLKLNPNERLYFHQLETSMLLNLDSEINHFDLVNNNILSDDNKIVLLDFDMANISSKYFDLTSIIEENDFNKDVEQIIIDEYFQDNINERNFYLENIYTYKSLLDYLWYFWALARKQTSINEKKAIYNKIANTKRNNLFINLKSAKII